MFLIHRSVLENWATRQTEICLLVEHRPVVSSPGTYEVKYYFHLLAQLLFRHRKAVKTLRFHLIVC